MQLSGNIFDYVVVFWAGVLVSFTPCLYPIIPITIGFIGGVNTQGTKIKGFIISLIYVLGMAVTYSSLAAFTALTGRVFGQIQNTPMIFVFVGVIFVLFSLMMFDVIRVPILGTSFLSDKIRPTNLWTIFLFGMISGLVVGPCTAPVLGSLLVYVASRQNILYGVSLLFVFAYGIGALIIILGTFTGLLSRLPKSGPWLVRIRQLCGFILFVAGGYYLIKAGKLLLSFS